MKKVLLTFFAAVAVSLTASAQNQVPNNSFENGTDTIADDWTVVSGKVSRITQKTFTVGGQQQTQTAPNGTYFMELAPDTFRDGSGNLRANPGVIGIKAPFSNRPKKVEFSTIYVPSITADRFGVIIQVTKWSQSLGKSLVVGTTTLASTGGAAIYPWANLSGNMVYQSDDMPDSMVVLLYSNYQQAQIGLGSRLYIDNFRFAWFVGNEDMARAGINEVSLFPNPMKENATIKYSITESARVKLSVMDMAGREVSTLVDETKIAGEHQAKLERNGLKAGMYIYRLQAGNKVETGKFIIAD